MEVVPFQLDQQQLAALQVDLEIDGVTITGASGSGKSTTLLAHLKRSLEGNVGRILAMTSANVHAFRARISAELTVNERSRITVCTPMQFALMQRHLLPVCTVLTTSEAEVAFTRCAAPLLEKTWPALESGEIDPEVSGLRSPDRFLAAAFRLMMKLLASDIDPTQLEDDALRATTQFYARPPNFSDPDLLRLIKEEHRSSLRVDRSILDHQRRREVDLTRIVAALFNSFAAFTQQETCLTEPACLRMLSEHLRAVPASAQIIRRRFGAVILDDAQDMLLTELAFLKAIWGEKLVGMMIAGDIHASMMSFRGARAQQNLSVTDGQILLHARRRGTIQLITAQQTIYSHPDAPSIPDEAQDQPHSLQLERTTDAQAQAEAIAAFIGEQLTRGVRPGECAVALRTLRCSQTIIEALLAHDIPVDCAGDIPYENDATTLDFVALLCCIFAPEQRPDALLRVLASPLCGLSDRSLALLCAPTQDPMLFAAEPSAKGREREKGDRSKRFIDHVFAGTHDHSLSENAQQRLAVFRKQITHWREQSATLSLRELIIDVVTESGIVEGNDVRTRFSKNLISRVISDLLAIHVRHPEFPPDFILSQWTGRMQNSSEEHIMEQIDYDAVCVTSVAALRGRSFTSIAIGDARAGAFPRYYVPEAMLYSPQRGFIARENAGSITSARTAKFTWYFEKTKVRDAYNSEDRRIFAYTLARATDHALITAWGPATRGRTAPEFLEELRNAQKGRKR